MSWLLLGACFCVWLVVKAIQEQGEKTRHLLRCQAADVVWKDALSEHNKNISALYSKDYDPEYRKCRETALQRHLDEAKAVWRDAYDIQGRGLHLDEFLGCDPLSTLALDIARLEVLAEWYKKGRSILRETPKRDSDYSDGYDIFHDDFDIETHQKTVRREIKPQKQRDRQKRLEIAQRKSTEARAFYSKLMPINLPYGAETVLPEWIIGQDAWLRFKDKEKKRNAKLFREAKQAKTTDAAGPAHKGMLT